jgi:hypothetical protein
MPTDAYFREQRYTMPSIPIGECTNDYCIGCEPGCGVDFARPEGPMPAVEYGPWPYSLNTEINNAYKQVYADMPARLFGL